MKIETDRLELHALNSAQLCLLGEDLAALEQELGFMYDGEPLSGRFLNIICAQSDKAGADAENYTFHSFWLLIRRQGRVAVGMASFKGPPGAEREVEIGYGLGGRHRGNRYMSEAVDAMCRWALSHPGVDRVAAETEPGNTASEHVLSRCGFTKYRMCGENTWWKLEHLQKGAES